ncbi:MAG: TrkA family potassium uptake protein [Chloroflexota bacterium]|nr:TrkA family potassium uptake protein [Chloroflexota bacterium]
MFVVIVGCSATGYHLAKLLMVAQHEVVVLEKSQARCQLMWDELGSVVMQGDGTDQVDLRRAGLTRADTVVAVTDRDATNLVICQMAKLSFSVQRTVAIIRDPRNQTIFRVLGVDSVVNVGDLVLDTLERTVVGSSFNHLAYLGVPNTMLVSITIPEDATIVGRKLAEVYIREEPSDNGSEEEEEDFFQGSFVTVVVRGDLAMEPSSELVLEANDEIYAVTTFAEESHLYQKLTGIW